MSAFAQLSAEPGFPFCTTGPTTVQGSSWRASSASSASGSGKLCVSATKTTGADAARVATARGSVRNSSSPASTTRTEWKRRARLLVDDERLRRIGGNHELEAVETVCSRR